MGNEESNAMNINKVTIAGHLGRDPEMKFTGKGTAICNLNVAVTRRWRTDQGEQKEETTWAGCTAFGKTAEVIGQYFKKGSAIYIDGRLKNDSWEDKATGKKQTKTGVVVESFQFVGGAKDRPAATEQPKVPSAPATTTDEDSVPF